jgi:hypothetical protein
MENVKSGWLFKIIYFISPQLFESQLVEIIKQYYWALKYEFWIDSK